MLRFLDTEMDPLPFPPANTYVEYQLSSLDQALEPIIPRIDQLDRFIEIAKANCHFPSKHNLTLDESAAIFIYTMKWDDNIFYRVIKRDLRSEDRSTSQSWFPYLILFDTAMQKLPNIRMNVWRGLNEDICKKLKKDDEFIWWNITSCSSSENVIKDCLEQNSILCFIEAVNGKDISVYSNSPNQNEIILCSGTRLQVVRNVLDQASSPVLHLRAYNHHIPSLSITNNSVANIISLQRYNSRVLSVVLHFIVLIVALLLLIVIGNAATAFESSYITAVLNTSYYSAVLVIFPWRSRFDHTSAIDKSSTFHIHVDTRGNRYEGEWLNDKKHGKGQMYFANGYKYTRDWVNDMAAGEGNLIWPNGDQYEGEFKDGQRHGKGSYYFANGDKYIGDWIEDKKSGYGIASLVEGKYEGQFKDDKMNGKGSYYFTNGDTYIGDWIDNKQKGQGVFTWTNGDRYEGKFKDGKLHGHSTYYFSNGNKFIGDWVDGERMTDHGAFTWAKIARRSTTYS